MTGSDPLLDGAEPLLELARDKLRVRGQTLSTVLARGRWRMPRRIARAAQRLVEAEQTAQNPRLRMMLDHDALAKDMRDLRAFLDDIDPADERKGWFLGILASLAINLLTLVVLLIAVMIWRGYL